MAHVYFDDECSTVQKLETDVQIAKTDQKIAKNNSVNFFGRGLKHTSSRTNYRTQNTQKRPVNNPIISSNHNINRPMMNSKINFESIETFFNRVSPTYNGQNSSYGQNRHLNLNLPTPMFDTIPNIKQTKQT